MQMLYNSDSYVVVQFDVPNPQTASADTGAGTTTASRGGFEIVDKFARKEIFLEGAVAESFQRGVEAIAAQNPQGADPETYDDFIAGFTELAQQPLVFH